MSDTSDAASRTEEPTPRKLEQAREKGEVVKTPDLAALASLSAVAQRDSAALSWTASPDSDVAGYRVERAVGASSAFVQITSSQAGQSFTDPGLADQTYRYRVRAVDQAGLVGDPSPELCEEIGDLLFAAANLARKLDVDAEAALRSANAKFERRFRGMETLAAQRGEIFADLNLDAQERLWQEVKRAE